MFALFFLFVLSLFTPTTGKEKEGSMCCIQTTFSEEGLLYCSSTILCRRFGLALRRHSVFFAPLRSLTAASSISLTTPPSSALAEMSDLTSALTKMELKQKSEEDTTSPPAQKEKEEKTRARRTSHHLQQSLQLWRKSHM